MALATCTRSLAPALSSLTFGSVQASAGTACNAQEARSEEPFGGMGRSDRPENAAPPEIFYDDTEARKYTENSRMVSIQTTLTERALELLALPDDGEPKLLLDIGCGSGLSGEALTERGHIWVVSAAGRCRRCCRRQRCGSLLRSASIASCRRVL